MVGYDVFARFYDATDDSADERAAHTRGLVRRHHPGARTVLELACGTGALLERLRDDYEVTGVDLSEEMLAVAGRKVPGVRLFRADMTRVSLGETFDVVLCVFDSLNHLLSFAEWEAAFDRAREHLAEGGIFVFDVNTEAKLARFAAERTLAEWFDGANLLVMKVLREREGLYLWHLRVFEQVEGADYRLHSADLPQAVFPIERIRPALEARFSGVSVHDLERARPSAGSQRLHFVCRA
jgi:SAM-dependent methyltransferase